jgi:3-vinyl bacteriochlorophyllide hydratase
MFTVRALDRLLGRVDACPWSASAGLHDRDDGVSGGGRRPALYTPEERKRRDSTPWTMVQGILAPVQFLIFLISLFLVVRYLDTGQGWEAATASVVVKTIALYAIMITGCIWEHEVFGRYLFAPAFFWEDLVSMIVMALHTAYLLVFAFGGLDPQAQMHLALAAYATYVVNAAQYIFKLRAARLEQGPRSGGLSAAKLS